MKSNWNYPTTVWMGENRSDDVVDACLISKIKNPIFVTDKNLINLPITIKIMNKLNQFFKEVTVNDDNQVIRRNRLCMLNSIKEVCCAVAELSRIQEST